MNARLVGDAFLAPAAIALLALLAFLIGLGDENISSRDEARPALVAREMLETGDWAIPHVGGRVYTEKPPLFTWAVVVLSRRGVTEWTLRLPSALAAAATVGITGLIGARLVAPAAGVVAAAVLASSFSVFQWARTGRMEMLLVLWITLGVWSVARWLDRGRAGDAALLGVWMGLGVMTKGPAALIPLGVAVLALAVLRPRRPGVTRHLALGLAVTLALLGVWLGLAALLSPDATAYLRGIGPTVAGEIARRPPRSATYAFEALGVGFLPWTPLLAGTIVLLYRRWRASWRTVLLPLLWVGVVLAAVAVFIQPREVYLLPTYPALALLAGWTVHAISSRGRVWLLAPFVALALALAMFAAWLHLTGASVTIGGELPFPIAAGPVTAALGLVALATAASAAGLLRAAQPTASAVVLAGGVLAALLLAETGFHTPALNRVFPMREAAQRLAAHLPRDARVAYVDRHLVPALVFYLPQRSIQLPQWEAAGRLAARTGVFVLLSQHEYTAVRDHLRLPLAWIDAVQIDGGTYVLAAMDEPR